MIPSESGLKSANRKAYTESNWVRCGMACIGMVRSGKVGYGMAFLGIGDINQVAQTIQTVEGYYPGSLAYRNNNPGNLRPAGQPGCTPVSSASGQFCSFDSYSDGYQALLNQISLDASRGLTIAQFLQKYAPASDSNDPTSYAATLAAATGLSVGDPLSAALGSSGSDMGTPQTAGFDFSSISSIGDLFDPSNTVSIAGVDVPVLALSFGGLIVIAFGWYAFRD